MPVQAKAGSASGVASPCCLLDFSGNCAWVPPTAWLCKEQACLLACRSHWWVSRWSEHVAWFTHHTNASVECRCQREMSSASGPCKARLLLKPNTARCLVRLTASWPSLQWQVGQELSNQRRTNVAAPLVASS